jgi:hypothetical protein
VLASIFRPLVVELDGRVELGLAEGVVGLREVALS